MLWTVCAFTTTCSITTITYTCLWQFFRILHYFYLCLLHREVERNKTWGWVMTSNVWRIVCWYIKIRSIFGVMRVMKVRFGNVVFNVYEMVFAILGGVFVSGAVVTVHETLTVNILIFADTCFLPYIIRENGYRKTTTINHNCYMYLTAKLCPTNNAILVIRAKSYQWKKSPRMLLPHMC